MRKKSTLYRSIALACSVFLLILLVIATYWQTEFNINPILSMEILTPALLIVFVLTIYFFHKARNAYKSASIEKEILAMKIAAITDDGKTISQHFGRAPYYLVATVENGQIVDREMREKLGHSQFASEPHAAEIAGQPHGMDPASHNKHLQMAEAITDCEALLCRGMGMGAYDSMKVAGIRPVVTDIAVIDEAVLAYASGQIVDYVDKLH
jgi:predicted Fe-Mo cluster-binding NifX family protein